MPEEKNILKICQALIDKAYSTTFPAERDSLLAKADALMMQYSIDQIHLLDPSRPNTAAAVKASKPELRFIEMMRFDESRPDSEVLGVMINLFSSLATHFQIRIGGWGSGGCKVVGYPADLDFLEMMFLSLKLHLVSNLDPRIDVTRPWQEQSPGMKQSGLQWEEVHERCRPHPNYPFKNEKFTKSIGLHHYGLYRKWATANPDVPVNKVRPEAWRLGFIKGYGEEIRRRLREMRAATIASNANLPALLNDKISVVEAFFLECFPPEPPRTYVDSGKKYKPVKYRTVNISRAAMGAGASVAKTADLSNPNSRIHGARPAL